MNRSIYLLLLVALAASGCATTAGAQDSEPIASSAPAAPHIAAVGDMVCHRGKKEGPNRNIEKWGTCEAMKVSQIVVDGDYEKFLALGDLQYLKGEIGRFRKYYDPTYGRVKDITVPVVGNHEYYTLTDGMWGAGYYTYFGEAAHPPDGYYSIEIGDWHVIVLNSQLCFEDGWWANRNARLGLPDDRYGCRPGDPQYEWLKQDLAAHPNEEYPCTLAAMHHPLFKWAQWPYDSYHRQRPLVRLLGAAGADVSLEGHHHNYQRFEPLLANGVLSDQGMAHFIVGSGGDTYGPIPSGDTWAGKPKPAGLVAYEGSSYGILDLTLEPTGYAWEFITAEGEPAFEDSGTADCH